MSIDIDEMIEILEKEHGSKKSAMTEVAEIRRDPFMVLVSCILSLRTKDEVTIEASKRLFKLADTMEDLSRLGVEEIEKAIYPVGFYRTKAERIKQISFDLINRYDSKVPDSIEELIKLKGVGRKTANIVITIGFGKLGIAVDTHVHRISNRLGYVSTKKPDDTEFKLRKKLPQRHWIRFNDLLVLHGKSICTPVSPRCSICPIYDYCERVGVEKSR